MLRSKPFIDTLADQLGDDDMPAPLALEAKPNGNGTPFAIEAITYPVLASRIGELAAEYMVLRVASVDDKEGLVKVHEARMTVKGLRVAVEKRRKELKAGALEYGRNVDSAAKQLTDLLEPIESHLITQEDIVTKEKERLAQVEAERIRQRTQERMDQLTAIECMVDPNQLVIMPDEQFAMILKAKQEAYAERKRVEAEQAAAQKAEAERLAAERAELARQTAEQGAAMRAEQSRLDAIQREQAAAQEKIDADRRKLAEEEAARLRANELEQARQQAAEKARIDTEQRLAREREEEEMRTKAAETARLKAEAVKPDKLKLLAVADAVRSIELPIVSSGAEWARGQTARILKDAADKISDLAGQLGGDGIAPLFQ